MPTDEAVNEIAGIRAASPQRFGHLPSLLASGEVANHNASARWKITPPALYILGRSMERARDQAIDSMNLVGGANIDDDGHRRCANRLGQISRKDGGDVLIHVQTLVCPFSFG